MAIAGRWRTFFRWRWIRSIGRILLFRMTTWQVHFARRRVRGIAGIMIRWRFGWRCLTSLIRLRRIRRLLLAGFARGREFFFDGWRFLLRRARVSRAPTESRRRWQKPPRAVKVHNFL